MSEAVQKLIEQVEKKMSATSAKIYRSYSNAADADKGVLEVLTWMHDELRKLTE